MENVRDDLNVQENLMQYLSFTQETFGGIERFMDGDLIKYAMVRQSPPNLSLFNDRFAARMNFALLKNALGRRHCNR